MSTTPSIDPHAAAVLPWMRVEYLMELARRMGCITEEQFANLCGVTVDTVGSWRVRHKGPAHILAGNRHLYREVDVKAWLDGKVREPRQVKAKDLL